MNIYKTAVYSALSLSILAVVSVLVILSDTLIGIDIILTIAYLILFAIITSVLFYSFKAIASNKSSLNNTLKMVGSFLVLFIICFLISSGEETLMREGKVLSAFSSKLIGASIIMFYLLILIASVAMLYFGVKSKK
ncbi:MAG: hypothetical protein CND26_02760 [Bacteroidetes bacterium MED-G13]|nr:MAG: hypothetical protein CND26_02760 [Bacteroidetes bacterium MED-G13]|tara:strand:+ start:9960 stop:10367 length:408 start_codon:yes stop_codon:yes gene_type:complete